MRRPWSFVAYHALTISRCQGRNVNGCPANAPDVTRNNSTNVITRSALVRPGLSQGFAEGFVKGFFLGFAPRPASPIASNEMHGKGRCGGHRSA